MMMMLNIIKNTKLKPFYSSVLRNLKESGCYESSDEDEHRPHKICMNLTCPKYSRDAPRPERPQYRESCERETLRPATEEDAADDLHAISSEPSIKMVTHTYQYIVLEFVWLRP